MAFVGVTGLRYGDCTAILAAHGLDDPEVWEGLRVIERVYLAQEAERRRAEERRHEHQQPRRRRR